jgi:ABC-2 type transport system ATP-binding protein
LDATYGRHYEHARVAAKAGAGASFRTGGIFRIRTAVQYRVFFILEVQDMDREAIVVDNLRKDYRTRVKAEGLKAGIKALVASEYRDVEAVKCISFRVQRGEMVAFIGPNGAGKSTTIKMLTGILHPSGGTMQVLGYNPVKERRELCAHIGTVFGQRSQLWMHLPPVDSFAMLGAIYGIEDNERRKRVDVLAQRFGLGEFLHTPVRKLSLGQRIRCEIAASLLYEPDILFLDEPTIGLDVVVKQAIRELILEWNREKGITVFLTSHDPGDVEHICRRAMVIDHGQVVLDQSVEQLKATYLNRKVITVKFFEPRVLPEMDGVTVTESGAQAVLTVDTLVQPIGEVMQAVTAKGGVADITVTDPPMEEIITTIFRSREVGL